MLRDEVLAKSFAVTLISHWVCFRYSYDPGQHIFYLDTDNWQWALCQLPKGAALEFVP